MFWIFLLPVIQVSRRRSISSVVSSWYLFKCWNLKIDNSAFKSRFSGSVFPNSFCLIFRCLDAIWKDALINYIWIRGNDTKISRYIISCSHTRCVGCILGKTYLSNISYKVQVHLRVNGFEECILKCTVRCFFIKNSPF